MADHELRDTDKSLVLSIFRGENFVIKGASSYRALIRAKCADLKPELALETGTVKLSPANSEPEFNSQLAWSVSRKQLKELRSNRSTIRVSCLVVDERNGIESEVGYVVLHVKDATTFDIGDVDPTKAKSFVLLGTKDAWRSVHPRLQMILQLEDLASPNRDKRNKPALLEEPSTSKVEHDVAELAVINAAKLSETKLLPKELSEKFLWTVNEKDGYFQLGTPADKDDLYMINTTVISASYLHLLWDGRSPRKRTADNYFWQIKYTAYGCEIASEPFLLAYDDESRRTFVGDKATARIRTNGALFFQYMQETAIEFRILRYQLGSNGELCNEEVMGLCYASLASLTDPNKKELRVALEIVTEWGTPKVISTHEKPEIRVTFNLDAVPNFYSLSNTGKAYEEHTNEVGGVQGLGKPTDIPGQNKPFTNANVNDHDIKKNEPASVLPETKRLETTNNQALGRNQHFNYPPYGNETESNDQDISNCSNVRRVLQYENETRQVLQDDSSTSPSDLESPKRRNITENLKIKPGKHPSSRKKHEFPTTTTTTTAVENPSDSEESEFSGNKENLAKILPEPGEYKVTVELTKFWLKSKRLITDQFILSYLHPPLGISDQPVECTSEALSPDFLGSRQGFMIMDGEFTKVFRITRLSESLVSKPLTVEFRRIVDGAFSKCFASSMVPFGRIFAEKGHQQVWILEDEVDILKISNNIKIGTLYFKILLSRDEQTSPISAEEGDGPRQSAFFPTITSKHDAPYNQEPGFTKHARDDEKMARVTEEMREWRKTQEESYRRQREHKESAYLKILSEEAAKRDAERENVMSKKLAELEKKEKEVSRKQKQFEEREEKLKNLESELKDNARQLALDQETLQQKSALHQRRLEENHKIEVGSLTRQIEGYKEEIEKLKNKKVSLEKKVETKEAEIDNLITKKRQQPDNRLVERVKLLEQENNTLKNQLRESNLKKEQYKKQSFALCQKLSRVHEERDFELKDQNDNLRLQIMASKEHKKIKKEQKAVQGLSETLKALKKETVVVNSPPKDGKGDQLDYPRTTIRKSDGHGKPSKEDEIQRLTDERSKLLGTGAYTQFDMVIKELEKKIISLAQE